MDYPGINLSWDKFIKEKLVDPETAGRLVDAIKENLCQRDHTKTNVIHDKNTLGFKTPDDKPISFQLVDALNSDFKGCDIRLYTHEDNAYLNKSYIRDVANPSSQQISIVGFANLSPAMEELVYAIRA